MVWTGSVPISIWNMADTATGSDISIDIVVPDQTAITANDTAICVISGKPNSAVKFGSQVGQNSWMAHIRDLQLNAGEKVTGTIETGSPGSFPGFAVGEGIPVFDNQLDGPLKPWLHFGGLTAQNWQPDGYEQLENNQARQVWRAYGRAQVGTAVGWTGAPLSLFVQWFWYFYPSSPIVEWELKIAYSDFLHAPDMADFGPVYMSVPLSCFNHVDFFEQRGGRDEGRVADRRWVQLLQAEHLATAEAVAWKGAIFVGHNPTADVSDLTNWGVRVQYPIQAISTRAAWNQTVVNPAGLNGTCWSIYEGGIPPLHPTTNGDTAATARWNWFVQKRLGGYRSTPTQHHSWVGMQLNPAQAGFQEDICLDQGSVPLGPPNGYPGYIHEAWFSNLWECSMRFGHFHWPGPGESAYSTYAGFTDGELMRPEDIPPSRLAWGNMQVDDRSKPLEALGKSGNYPKRVHGQRGWDLEHWQHAHLVTLYKLTGSYLLREMMHVLMTAYTHTRLGVPNPRIVIGPNNIRSGRIESHITGLLYNAIADSGLRTLHLTNVNRRIATAAPNAYGSYLADWNATDKTTGLFTTVSRFAPDPRNFGKTSGKWTVNFWENGLGDAGYLAAWLATDNDDWFNMAWRCARAWIKYGWRYFTYPGETSPKWWSVKSIVLPGGETTDGIPPPEAYYDRIKGIHADPTVIYTKDIDYFWLLPGLDAAYLLATEALVRVPSEPWATEAINRIESITKWLHDRYADEAVKVPAVHASGGDLWDQRLKFFGVRDVSSLDDTSRFTIVGNEAAAVTGGLTIAETDHFTIAGNEAVAETGTLTIKVTGGQVNDPPKFRGGRSRATTRGRVRSAFRGRLSGGIFS